MIERLQADEDRAGVAAGVSASGANRGGKRLHIGIVFYDFGDDALMTNHVIQRNSLGSFSVAEQESGITAGNETFGNNHEQIDSHAGQNEADGNRH